MNSFIETLRNANQQRWCVKPFCTTCGAQDFRAALRKLAGANGKGLVEALSSLDLSELRTLSEWDDAIRLALGEINQAPHMDEVLRAWLPHLQENIALADVVLFYFVKRGALFAPMSVEILRVWIDACVKLAVETRNESLLESLVYTLGARVKSYADLNAVIALISSSSSKIRLAQQRSGVCA